MHIGTLIGTKALPYLLMFKKIYPIINLNLNLQISIFMIVMILCKHYGIP